MISTAIVDSGPLLAAANRSDPDHRTCLEILQDLDLYLVIPALCVAEVSYFLQKRRGSRAEAAFLGGLGDFDVRAPHPDDWRRISELVLNYEDFPLGGTDASVIALAERFETDLVVSLDRRHFSTVQPRHCDRLRILP